MKFIYKDKEYNIKIIRKNNKNTYLRYKDNEIVITTSIFVTDAYISKIVNNNRDFIEKTIDNNKIIPKDDRINLFTKKYRKICINNIKDIEIEEDIIYYNNNKNLQKYISNYIYKVYLERLNYWASIMEEHLPNYILKIRKMTTRWGTCNIKNHKVTLNLELSNYEIKYLDYVIVHELCHFTFHDHSKEFWKLVGKYYPNYKEIRKEMKKFHIER